MHAIPRKFKKCVETDAPDFVQAVRKAEEKSRVRTKPKPVSITLDQFYDNAVLLYLCLWYADTRNVPVTFKPTPHPM